MRDECVTNLSIEFPLNPSDPKPLVKIAKKISSPDDFLEAYEGFLEIHNPNNQGRAHMTVQCLLMNLHPGPHTFNVGVKMVGKEKQK